MLRFVLERVLNNEGASSRRRKGAGLVHLFDLQNCFVRRLTGFRITRLKMDDVCLVIDFNRLVFAEKGRGPFVREMG